MERRQVIGGAFAAGVAGLAGSGAAEAGGQDDGGVANAVNNLYRLFDREFEQADRGTMGGAALVRQQQRTFLRANHKYPDFIEVGVDIWESVYNWHIHHRVPILASRLADGRYTLMFMFTSLLMRTDTTPDYVSLGFDTVPSR